MLNYIQYKILKILDISIKLVQLLIKFIKRVRQCLGIKLNKYKVYRDFYDILNCTKLNVNTLLLQYFVKKYLQVN